MTRRLLVLGESDVGKSHFGGQLLGRLNQEKGALRMDGAPPTLAAFETVLHSMNRGYAALHTPQSTYVDSIWPLADKRGRTFQLEWPDYGGEQLRDIRTKRVMPIVWRDRIAQAGGWIVMIRIAHYQPSDDIFSRPLAEPGKERQAPETFTISPQAQLIDLLQWLMFVRKTGTLHQVSSPPLMLLLSCWDELPAQQLQTQPAHVLKMRMPMVSAFVEANWSAETLHVIGVSALERALTETEANQDFIDLGPEAFGYVILPDGRKDSDLTLAIAAMV